MEEQTKSKKMVMKQACHEDTRLELRLCPPGDDLGFDSNVTTQDATSVPTKAPKPKRVAQPAAVANAGVVGWPPVRTLRKNMLISSNPTKVAVKVPSDGNGNEEKSLYVKINMDGVGIGRKVDLKAYDTYQKLSSAVDELFGGLLAAQRFSSSRISNKQTSTTTKLLDGSGEYTLVYEDNEGDRILVGDVPWDMFISSAKRLRVLKTSELSVSSTK